MAGSVCPQFNPQVETVVEFIERFRVQCADLLENVGDNEKKKAAVLVKALPVNIITDLQRRIKPGLLSDATYKELEEKLTSQYEVKKSIVGAAVQFMNRKQLFNESTENYAKVINDLASACKYKACCRDRLLRDAFVSGLRSSTILGAILPECENKTFNECVEKAKVLEQFTSDAQDIKLDTKLPFNNKVATSSTSPYLAKSIPDTYVCIRCTARAKHLAKNCFAISLHCKKCGKVGHIARACKSFVFTAHNGQQDSRFSPSISRSQQHLESLRTSHLQPTPSTEEASCQQIASACDPHGGDSPYSSPGTRMFYSPNSSGCVDAENNFDSFLW